MKTYLKSSPVVLILLILLCSCKKDNKTNSASPASALVGFWTYKEDAAQDYWNQNVLFKSDGSFRAYTALSLADTAAGPALADTAQEVITFGTYTVNGASVEMIYSEFTVVGLKFEGSLNSSKNILIGNIESNDASGATPLFYLTRK